MFKIPALTDWPERLGLAPPGADAEWGESPDIAGDELLRGLCSELLAANVTMLHLSYSGSGFDDDGISEVAVFPEGGPQLNEKIVGQLVSLETLWLPENYSRDDGSVGSISIWPALGVAKREHQWYENGIDPWENAVDLDAKIKRALKKAKIASVRATFDGSGDEGTVTFAEPDDLDSDLEDELDTYITNTVLGGGWMDNNGSRGSVLISVKENRVEISGGSYVTELGDPEILNWRWRD